MDSETKHTETASNLGIVIFTAKMFEKIHRLMNRAVCPFGLTSTESPGSQGYAYLEYLALARPPASSRVFPVLLRAIIAFEGNDFRRRQVVSVNLWWTAHNGTSW